MSCRWSQRSCADHENSEGHPYSTTATDRELTSSPLPQEFPTLVSKPAVSEAGGNPRAPENSKARAKPQSLPLSGDREDDSPLSSRALDRESASKGQTVLASKKQVTDPSPGATNGAMNLMRLHRPQHLQSTGKTNESGVDLRSTSPRKVDGGDEWHGAYRDRG